MNAPSATETGWHAQTAEETLRKLDSLPSGLSESEAERRFATHGPNRLPAPPRPGALRRFLLQFHNVLIYALLGSAAVTGALGHWIDTAAILAVVAVNAVIGFIQEGKAEKAMDAIREMLAPRAAVIRDGARAGIDGIRVVPGDVVTLEAGDKVPADLRLLAANGLMIQEAVLTGESVPVEKRTAPVEPAAPLGDRVCLAFSGTLVTAGQGRGVVVATGKNTEIGRISCLLSEVESLTTPLVAKMGVFAKWLTVFILLVAGLLLAYGYVVRHHDFSELFMAVVGLSVAAIPEGLPAVITITLAVGVRAMARRNAIVRRLPAIEAIGSVSVICTDKTGTLTRNEMMVASVVTEGRQFQIDGTGYEPRGAVRLDGTVVASDELGELAELGRVCLLCNDAALTRRGDAWIVEGDPMEGALQTLARKLGLDPSLETGQWRRTDVIPFDSNHRFMAVLNHDHEGHGRVFLKGAPEQVIERCARHRLPDGGSGPIDRAAWHARAEAVAGLGQRVLALAVLDVRPAHAVLQHRDLDGPLTLVGLVGLIDPPRAESVAAIAECRAAGIRVKMITGDHARTAAAIGKDIGLTNTQMVLTGADLDRLDDSGLQEAVLDCDIFARTSPEHKLRLVKALQARGLTVAMTGDGVNDAPALKRADAGIAMGGKGSEAAKEAAELVLADDNFASIVAAVREGRTVYDNIRKVIQWTLPTNAGEALIVIVALLFGLTLPVTAIQILWINLITCVTLGMALAFEPTESAAMRRPPRQRGEPILTGALVWQIILVSVLFLAGGYAIFDYALDRGYPLEKARTLVLNTIVTLQTFQLFFVRNLHGESFSLKSLAGTRILWGTVALVAVAQLAVTYLAPFQKVFITRSIGIQDMLVILGIGAAMFAILETEKRIRFALRSGNG